MGNSIGIFSALGAVDSLKGFRFEASWKTRKIGVFLGLCAADSLENSELEEFRIETSETTEKTRLEFEHLGLNKKNLR